MLKNILKRTVSTFLALTLVVSTVCFFDLSEIFPTAEATVSVTPNSNVPDVYIVVPEIFYLTPSLTTSTTVQYYINNTLTSKNTVTPDESRNATSGKIWFKTSGTVSGLKYSISGTNKSNVSITAGSSSTSLSGLTLTSGLSAKQTTQLEWTFSCQIDGVNAEYHAYTTAYAPYYTPVGTIMDGTNNRGNDSQMQGAAWISGVHSYSDTTNFSKYYARTVASGSWNTPMVPLITPITAPWDNNQDSMDWFTTSSTEGCSEPTFSEYTKEEGTSSGNCKFEMALTSQTANLTVDISRNKNFNTVPNLTTGMFVSDVYYHYGGAVFGVGAYTEIVEPYGAYMATFKNTDNSLPANDWWNNPGTLYYNRSGHHDNVFAGTYNSDNNNNRDYHYTDIIQATNGVWDCATPTSAGTGTWYIHAACCGESGSDWIYLNHYIKVDWTAVNKQTLREKLLTAQKQANALTSGISYTSNVLPFLRNAYAALGNPTATQKEIDNAVQALEGAALYTNHTKTTTAMHINARTGELMPGSNAVESVVTKDLDTVSVSANSYTGYTLTDQFQTGFGSLFDFNKWKNSTSYGAGSVTNLAYDTTTKTLSFNVPASDTHTVDYRSSDITSTNYDYFAVDGSKTYALKFDYAGTGNGDIGVHCYGANGAWLGVNWLHTVNDRGLMAATGSTSAFRSETVYYCPANWGRPTTHYISLCFGGYPNDGAHGTPAATSGNPLSCVFRNVTWTPAESLFDMNAWKNTSSGNAGSNQTLVSYDTTSQTLKLSVTGNDTFTPRITNASQDIRTSGYYYFEVDARQTYTISYEYAGTANGDIGVHCYDENGRYLGAAWFHRVNYEGMMKATGSDTQFQAGSFDFCPATYIRPATNSSYITPDVGARTRYMALSLGSYPNNAGDSTYGPAASSANPLSCVFRAVRVTPKAPDPNLFDAAAWANSSCAANGSGVSSVSFNASTNTIEVVNSGTDTYTSYANGNILNSGYYYIPFDPDGTYTLDFDYASPTRGEIGVICYDGNGDRIGNMWLFDSLKASGSTTDFRHHTEVICPQSNYYLYTFAKRFNVHYIALTFGNYAESGQSAATCLFRNVSITPNNELFDMAQWSFRSGNNYGSMNNVGLQTSDWTYDSGSKTLTITAKTADTASGYPDNLLTDSVTVGGSAYPYFYTPVKPGTTYWFEGDYAGTGNGDLGIIEYKADGTIQKKSWKHKVSVSSDFLASSGSVTEFRRFSVSLTTTSNTKYIALAFGGYPNNDATASNPVYCVFRDVKMHVRETLSVPAKTDSAFKFYYRPNEYVVTYDGNGSTSGDMNSQKFFYNEAQNLYANAFARVVTVSYNAHGGDLTTVSDNTTATMTFDGWATTAAGTAAYSDRQSVTNLTTTDGATVTLYAKWTGGSVSLPTPMRAGYTFEGWFTAESGGTNVGTSGSYTPDADIELHARWQANSFTLTFNNNGVGPEENMPPDMTLYYNTASDPLPAPKSPDIDGWHFLGWTDEEGSGGIGDDEENIVIGGGSRSRGGTTRDGSSSDAPTIKYYAGDVIPAADINDIYTQIGVGESYTLYAVWQKTFTVTFVDYSAGVQRTQPFESIVYNGASTTFATDSILQGTHTGWTRAGWTQLRRKGAPGSVLPAEIQLDADNNLFDIDAWAASNSFGPNVTDGRQSLSYDGDSETLTSTATSRDVASKYYNGDTLLSSGVGINYIEVDPYKTYTLGVDYAGTAGVSGQVGIGLYDADGKFIKRCWLFSATNSSNGDIHRGGDHFGNSTGATDFRHEDIEFCPMTFEISYFNSLTPEQRASIKYITLSFGSYTDGVSVSSSNPATMIFRNVTFTENLTYYGVYTKAVRLTYDDNSDDNDVTGMPQNPAAQNRIANSALGFGADDILNPTFALSSTEPARTGYTYQGWNTDPAASTGTKTGNVTIDADTTYYAIWTSKPFYIAFDKNGVGEDTNMPAAITAHYDETTGQLPAPTQTTVDGWTFRGWAVTGALTTPVYQAGDTIPAADTVTYFGACGGENQTYTLYAVWEKTITVTFNDYLNGAAHSTQISETVYNGAQASFAANRIPTQSQTSGWTEAGWTTSQLKGAMGNAVGALTLSENRTYYGVYTKQVALTYNEHADGDTVTGMPSNPSPALRYANSYLGLSDSDTQNPVITVSSATPVRTGYTFQGWNESATETSANIFGNDELALTANKTLYAIWSLNAYVLTVEATVGGSVAGSFVGDNANIQAITVASNGSAEYSICYNRSVFGLVPTAAAGYTFTRWTATGITLANDAANPLSFNMPASAVTLTAVFTPNTYSIIYNPGNGATGTAQTQTCTYDQNVTFYRNSTTAGTGLTVFSKTGYTFDCWNDAADGSGSNDYTAGSTTSTPPNFTATPNGTVNLYAKWSQNDYTITYALGGGNHGATHPNSAVFDVEFYVSAPTRDGYTFSGWTVTSGLDTAAAKWGASSADTSLTSASTPCINGASGVVYFKNLTAVDDASVTLTATWTPKTYTIVYVSDRGDNKTVTSAPVDYNANVTLPDEDVFLPEVYAGYTFSGWFCNNDGSLYDTANNTFNLENVAAYTGNETVQMIAQWSTNSYRIVYDLNGSSYSVSDIVSVGITDDDEQWTWKESEDEEVLAKESDTVIPLYSAYDTNFMLGEGFYFYLKKANEVRFGLGWSFQSGATTVSVPFDSDLSINAIPNSVLTAASPVDGEPGLYEITLYMVWSANYYSLENAVAQFQNTYMTFPNNAATLRGTVYGNSELPVYTDAPSSAVLPAVSSANNSYADTDYVAKGVRARELVANITNPAHGKYAWVAGPIGDDSQWDDLDADSRNDFTSVSLQTVNGRIQSVYSQLVYDPCTQFGSGDILPQASQSTLDTSVTYLTDAILDNSLLNDVESDADMIARVNNSYLLSYLRLLDVDLDKKLTDAEMTAFETSGSLPFGSACETAANHGISYSPSTETANYLSTRFGQTVGTTYPPCETDSDGGHHSFNSMLSPVSSALGDANAIFALFGFDPAQPRNDSVNYFRVNNEFIDNPNCPYTTESVYKLFDLIYGQRRNDVYQSALNGGQNTGNVALYYQVMDILGSGAQTTLRKPSQEKLDKIVTMIAYEYHSLVLKKADYESEFSTLFRDYFDATWGTRLGRTNGGTFALGTNDLAEYQGYFTTESYNRLKTFIDDYFSDRSAGILWPDGDGARDANNHRSSFPYRNIVEQNYVDGKVAANSQYLRTYKNSYIPATDVDLSAFRYEQDTLCAEFCDLIDRLEPATADYSEVFRLIARNVCREADAGTYMIDVRTGHYDTEAKRNAFYPSTADNVVDTYSTWRSLYANSNAWGGTVENPQTHETKPLYDTEWLYRYYAQASVDALRDEINAINWNLNKLQQNQIDGMTGSAYTADTICSDLKAAIDGLTPKSYKFYFYYGLPDNNSQFIHIDDYPEDPSDPNSADLLYRFGMTFVSPALTPDAALTSGKTFMGWYTKANDTTHCVSSVGNIYVVNLPIDENLLETWVSAGKAEVSSEDGVSFKVNLYGGYVENVTLDIDLDDGTATYTPADADGTAKTPVYMSSSTASPTYNYGWTLTFSNMAKEGYRFRAWDFTAGSSNTGSSMTGNVYTFGYYTGSTKTNDALTALWDANTYTVRFHANHADATGSMSNQSFTYDTPQNLTACGFHRDGYRFVHWTLVPGDTGTAYNDEAQVSNLTSVHEGYVDLYAQWEVADFTMTFHPGYAVPSESWFDASLAAFEWSDWNGGENYTDGLTKTITFAHAYNAADADGHTWPTDPKVTYEISGDVIVTVTFQGWFTAASGGSQITPDSTVGVTSSLDVYPHFNFARTKLLKDKVEIALEQMNANDYTMAYMQSVDAVLEHILDNEDPDYAPTDADLANLQNLLDNPQYADANAADGDTTPPIMTVYENKTVLQDAVDSTEFVGNTSYMLEEDGVGDISFVFPGKCYYTYYCYTNSTTPAIMINAHDVAGANNRISYPTTFTAEQKSGTVLSGWMRYTWDDPENNESGRSADLVIMERKVDNPYRKSGNNGLTYFGMNYSEGIYQNQRGYNFYTHEQYVLLKPTFVENGGKQFALYTLQLTDDAYQAQVAQRAKLAGAVDYSNYATEGANLAESANETITQPNTITIFVEYNNTMKGQGGNAGGQYAANGVGNYGPTGALEVYNNFHEDGNTWVKVDYLYRNAAGIANTDFVSPQFKSDGSYPLYIANDPVFGQTDVGSFYYLMKPDDPATSAYWDAYSRYLDENDPSDLQGARNAGAAAALDLMNNQVKQDLKNEKTREKMSNTWSQAAQVANGDYIYWPYTGSTQWSTQFYARATEDAERLVYVHIYDRWGNHYTNILIRDKQDTQPSRALSASRGTVTVNEVGGSSIRNITITEQNSQKPIAVSGMTDDGTWNVVNNQFTITGLPQGSNNYNYTLTTTDVAGNTYSSDFQAASDGSVVVTVNDETMGGKYAAAAAAPAAQMQGEDAANGIGAESIAQAPLTTLAIDEVTPDLIVPDTIEEAQLAQAGDEERPDLYTFTLNEVYTVNLFADSARDYDVTLKCTVGGVVKAYVNGEFSPAKSGKVKIPAGSQVQIRVSSRTGYELESLKMIYPDDRSVDLIGAYNAEINDDVTIRATFVKTDALLTVRVENGAVSGKQELHVSPYSRVTVVAQAAPEGKVFAYWAQDGEYEVPVSYDEIYTFIVTSSTVLKAVYADEPTAQTANIAMDAQSPTHINVVNGMYTLSYSGKVTLPEGAQIEEFGLLLTNQSADACTSTDFVIGGKVNGVNVAKLAGQTLTEEGQCKINVNNVKPGQTRTGRLYLVVKLADGTTQTLYSNTWSELNTPAV